MIEIEEIDRIIESRLKSLDFCYQCGICSGLCPLSFVSAFRPRKFIIGAQIQPEKVLNSDILWQCTTCNACVIRCPEGVEPPQVAMSLRSKMVEEGRIPKGVQEALEGTFKHYNPWGIPKSKRANWAKDLNIKHVSNSDLLYFVGCAPSYDTRNQSIAKAIVKIFQKAGVNFGILGEEEKCCGNSVRTLGEEGLFQMLAEENTQTFNKYNKNKKIVTTSPHCYSTFKNDYSLNNEVLHYSELLTHLLEEGKIVFSKEKEKTIIKVTYHDPCYLGRHNGVYDAPRFVLNSLPGVELVEMERTKERSFCCGGGGGRMWVDVEEQRRPSEIRVEEALKSGAEVLVSACPFCLTNFEDAVKILNVEDKIKIKDLAELVSELI
jgi:Fe-S oxidoreductase